MGWQVAPNANGSNAVSMVAVTATDASGDAVQYYFRCVSGGAGCSDSGWISSSSYTDSGLSPDTLYSWRVRARDASGNETAESFTASARTDAEQDTTPPNPNPMGWAVVPAAAGETVITMTATTAVDASGSAVQYYFSCVAGGAGCADSGWQNSTSYTASGLQPGTSYSWRVRARDAVGNQTGDSSLASAVTDTVIVNQPPAAPSGLVAEDNGDRATNLWWQDNSNNETGFEVEREDWRGKHSIWRRNSVVAKTGENVNFVDGIGDRGVFRYRVRAVNAYGYSAYSEWVEITITK